MALAARTRLGPYEVVAPIGAGGMGEVYKARDTKLDREVAIKVLPAAFAQDPERLARFEREAKVLAALNHPNIAQIYGFEESDGIRALAMELVPGGPPRGPLPLETALNYAKQIADALEAAHEKGVTHRDLKPANIMITPEGVVKVLDFGLASIPSREGGGDPTNSPTMTMAATQAGMIMGTAAYMSPEQAAGKVVDKRSDIWSFGVVLWEMITGAQLFGGETISYTLADVLRAPIDFASLPAATHAPIAELLKRCLDRDVKTRLRDIGEARVTIQKCLANPKGAIQSPPAESRTPSRWAWGGNGGAGDHDSRHAMDALASGPGAAEAGALPDRAASGRNTRRRFLDIARRNQAGLCWFRFGRGVAPVGADDGHSRIPRAGWR
jgi:serine/threonine protein kinase